MKIVYCTPALYMAGGVERVLTMKANHLAEVYGYDITIILTEGADKPLFYPLSDKVNVVNLDIGFEVLWTCSFIRKIFVYLKKQRQYRKALERELLRIHPDITVSLLRREINFISSINDGSRKVGELHVNRANYRNFEGNKNIVKSVFAKWWMWNLVRHLRHLDRFVVLTEEDKAAWAELDNVVVIPNPLPFIEEHIHIKDAPQGKPQNKRILAVGRYAYQKGFDMLLTAWSEVEKRHSDWSLAIYGDGNREEYVSLAERLGIDMTRCHINPPTKDIRSEYADSSLFVMSSRFEGFGLVLIEAMSCALPVISFACPCGPKDIITDGSGVLVDNGNIEKLAEAMDRLMADEPLRQRLAAGAFERSKAFHIDRIGERWNELFLKVCSIDSKESNARS